MAWSISRYARVLYFLEYVPHHIEPHTGKTTHHRYRFVLLNTLRPRKNVVISQTTFSNAFSWMKMYEFRLKFHRIMFLGAQLKNIPALVQIMAWHPPGHKPYFEPMTVPFTVAYMSLGLKEFSASREFFHHSFIITLNGSSLWFCLNIKFLHTFISS